VREEFSAMVRNFAVQEAQSSFDFVAVEAPRGCGVGFMREGRLRFVRSLTIDDPLLAHPPDLTGPGDLPAYMRIGYWLERLIVSRKLEPGDRLPSEVEIANALGVSRMTLRQALASIEAKGLIDRRRGRFGGNFVATPRFEFDHESLPGFTEQMRRMHVEAGAHVIRATTRRPPADVRQGLGLKRGEQVHEVLRARSANGEPIVLEETYFPAAVFPGLLLSNLTGSLYSVMRASNAAPHSAEEQIEATGATEQQAEILNIAAGDPLLLITRTSYTAGGVAVEYSRDYHRSDRSRIRIKSRVDNESSTRVVPAAGT
jgi:GntR family transcriptional regulator